MSFRLMNFIEGAAADEGRRSAGADHDTASVSDASAQDKVVSKASKTRKRTAAAAPRARLRRIRTVPGEGEADEEGAGVMRKKKDRRRVLPQAA